jgi:hypothetical protein
MAERGCVPLWCSPRYDTYSSMELLIPRDRADLIRVYTVQVVSHEAGSESEVIKRVR